MNGRLFPFNWIKLLWRMKVKRPKTARMPMMGVRKALQILARRRGAGAVGDPLGARIQFLARRRPTANCPGSWSATTRVRHVIEMVGGVPYKTYRVYEKPL